MGVILRDLHTADAVVGRHGFDVALDPSLPVVGNENGIDYEALVRASPNRVLMERDATAIPPRLERMGADRAWTIHTHPMLTLDDIGGAIAWLDQLATGAETPSPRAGELFGAWERALLPRPDVAQTLGRTLTLAWTDPVGVMGPGSFHWELIERLGAESLPREGSAYISMSVEDVVRLAPDSIVLVMPGAEQAEWRDRLGALAGRDLAAEASGRVFVVGHELALIPATSLIEVLAELEARVRGLAGDEG